MNWFQARGIRRTDAEHGVLVIPDVRQQDNYDCGAACVDAVAEFFGLRKRGPARQMRTALGSLANPIQGISPDTVAAMLRALGLSVLSGTMTIADLRHLTGTGRPVLCPRQEHWLVVAGVSRGFVHYHDPQEGMRKEREGIWIETWSDTSESGQSFRRWGISPSL